VDIWKTVLLALLSGIGGWFFTNLIFHPWKEVQALRRQSRFELLSWGNLSSRNSSREMQTAGSDALRKVAFSLLALTETSPRWFLPLLHSYDLTKAANTMISLARALAGNDILYKAMCRHEIEKSLLLSNEYTDAEYECIKTKWIEDCDEDFADEPTLPPIEELFHCHDMSQDDKGL
jgi:hypothetical protein